MSDKIKRYELEYRGLVEDEFGDWVRYEDYQALEKELAESEYQNTLLAQRILDESKD